MKLIVGVIGMGYVGLPLAIEIAKKYKVIGYDIDANRINSLRKGIDIKNQEGDLVCKSRLTLAVIKRNDR